MDSVELEERMNIMSRLCHIGQELASLTDLDELLAKIIDCCKDICSSDKASILLLDESRNELYFKQTSGSMGEDIRRIRIPLNEKSIAGWSLIHRETVKIDDVSTDPRHYKGVDEATGYETKTLLAVPVMWGDRCFGVVEAVNKLKEPVFTDADADNLKILAQQAAVAINNVFLVEELQNFFVHTIEILINALEAIDPYSRGHVMRVARYATSIAREVGITGKEFENILYASYFHDIGLLRKDANILNKRDPLHPVIGASILEQIKILEKTAAIVKAHHEYYDGTGFPNGLKGEEIPLAARILSLVEDYDEESSSINAGRSKEKFNKDFFEKAFVRHDPELVKIFKKIVEPGVN
ncbi:MAG: GAF domain-containing protein [Firmicutes bacterium]|nr:GAF domain-containing protein [Bacillota bacterium]